MTGAHQTPVRQLHQLARLSRVQLAYTDAATRRRCQASPEALLAVLRALGAAGEALREVPAALRERRQALWRRPCEPVVVAWDGRRAAVALRLPAPVADGPAACELTLETGEVRRWRGDLSRPRSRRAVEVEGTLYVTAGLPLPGGLPWGYHRLTGRIRGRTFESLLLVAPRRAYTPAAAGTLRSWGVFLPLYALQSDRSWGAGDLSDLEAFTAWVAGLGGTVVGTLPLLAGFLDEPFDPSPYAPASRLFWNEFYLDVTRVPELERSAAARALLASATPRETLRPLRASPLVDWRRAMAAKRQILEELARCFFAADGERQAAFRQFAQAQPAVEDYARFRAACERQGSPWPAWPRPLRDGLAREGDYGEEARRYHLYAQWLAHEQVEQFFRRAREAGAELYLDMPLGVHPAGYDVWRERALFALEAWGGAPPDAVFTAGQNWGFPPLHPEAIREQGYRYVIACLRHQLRHAGVLRVDHVMGLHRLFWIPKGLSPRDGVYVRYAAEELYAILSLESQRHRTWIVGENLGTVPPDVNPTMARHHIQQMYVVQYELAPGRRRPLRPIPRECVASLNTHDMPPFAAFWEGLDIAERLGRGLLSPAAARAERRTRRALRQTLARFLRQSGHLGRVRASARSLLRACLGLLSASPARLVLVNLEDLWLETRPQNVPGTAGQLPNWQRKARYAFEAFRRMPGVLGTLREVDRRRREARSTA